MRVVRLIHPPSSLGASDAFAMLLPSGQFMEVPSQVSSAEMPGFVLLLCTSCACVWVMVRVHKPALVLTLLS